MILVLTAFIGLIVVLLVVLTRGGGVPAGPAATPTPTNDPLDPGVFFLEIIEPAEPESVVLTPGFTVTGRTRSDAAVTINDTVVSPGLDGRFSLVLTLEEGPNVIEVVASVATGEQLDKVLAVIYAPE